MLAIDELVGVQDDQADIVLGVMEEGLLKTNLSSIDCVLVAAL